LGLRLREYGRGKEYGRTAIKEKLFLPENTINPLETAERKN
jgi:hypothetical protein